MNGKNLLRYSVAMALLGTPVVFADDGNMQPSESKMHADMNNKDQSAAMTARASKLIGMNVYNDAGESLGEINELVLDSGQNRISYAVLSFGGWMGIRDKLFAVPWNQFQQRGAQPGKLYLNVPKDHLKNAPGFDKNSWPDRADRTYWQGVDKYYPSRINDASAHAGMTRSDPAHTATNAPATQPSDATTTDPPANTKMDDGLAWNRKVSDVIGADVRNQQDENLGDIKDLVIDTSNGSVRYAVVSFGGWLGIGDKLFAVPMSALQHASDKEKFTMNVTKDQMKSAPGFDNNAWPDFANPQWSATNDAFYGGNSRTSSQAARE